MGPVVATIASQVWRARCSDVTEVHATHSRVRAHAEHIAASASKASSRWLWRSPRAA